MLLRLIDELFSLYIEYCNKDIRKFYIRILCFVFDVYGILFEGENILAICFFFI
jgi:hypothetical protein